MTEYQFGERFENNSPSHFSTNYAKALNDACEKRKDFEIISIGVVHDKYKGQADLIIVECNNGQVPTKNDLGILVREPLALCFFHDSKFGPEARALRKSFPINLIHTNVVPPGEPQSLCIYYESWHAAERTWTPQKFLKKILWWLAEAAKGTLHPEDQPVERVYFNSPYELVLPSDFNAKIQDDALEFLLYITQEKKLFKGDFVETSKVEENKNRIYPLYIDLGAIVHDATFLLPATLGSLDDQLKQKGHDIAPLLQGNIKEKVGEKGVKEPAGKVLLILKISVQRHDGGPTESEEFVAFWITKDFTTLGQELGSLFRNPGNTDGIFFADHCNTIHGSAWRSTDIMPVDVTFAVTPEDARTFSGLNVGYSSFKGVIGGVGALGATMVELWAKGGWGDWTLIDDDLLRSHNIVRHVAKEKYVGCYKADAVAHLAAENFQQNIKYFKAIPEQLNSQSEKVKAAIKTADLVVDATTTLNAPRDLAHADSVPRIASVFLTPSGRGSALLIEDSNRDIKIDCLEAQYYRAILNNSWGEKHLQGHLGNIVVGAGCRDISMIMSFEDVSLHTACLTKQVRLCSQTDLPAIRVWHSDSVTGSVSYEQIDVSSCFEITDQEWRIVCDDGLQAKLKEKRNATLPNETGGVILGYIDQKLKSIFIVDVLDPPTDSGSSPNHFIRGVEGLNDMIEDAASRTANIVGYIGEWHSHPPFTSPLPSGDDKKLVNYLAGALADDGLPVLMVIVGSDGDLNFTVKQQSDEWR